VVIERPGAVALRELDAPVCGPDDVVVRSRAAGVCRTDLEVLRGELDPRWVRYPCVPGHEWSGEIAEVGEAVEGLSVGDRVVCEGMIPCGRCRRCTAGETNLCENYDQLGFTRVGGYGELVLVPARVAHRLPDEVGFDEGVLVEPASVVLRALERARPPAPPAAGCGRDRRRDRCRDARLARDPPGPAGRRGARRRLRRA
jgi:D-arabinose 1-dehydrogenase-like Zn-dependent alcohol dehydrogenase